MAVKRYSTPGTYRIEVDQSEVLTPAGTSVGAVIGRFQKGPINRPVLVSSDKELVDTFGEPLFTSGASGVGSLQSSTMKGIPDYGYGWYSANEFLKESNSLYVGRVCDTNDMYAGLYIKTSTYDYTTCAAIGTNSTSAYGVAAIPFVDGNQFDTGDNISSIETSANFGYFANSDLLISSLYPGTDGNNIAVSIETYSSASDFMYKYDGYPTSGNPSEATQTIGIQVCRIDVYTKDSSQSWDSIKYNIQLKQTSGVTSAFGLRELYTPVETFYGTLASQLDVDNNQLLLTDVVNGNSKYIYVKIGSGASFGVYGDSLGTQSNLGFLRQYDLHPLAGGTIAYQSGLGDDELSPILDTWDLFKNRELLPNVNILINPDWNTSVKQKVGYIAASRMDCIATGQSGDLEDTVDSDIKSQEAYGYSNPNYMALYAGWDKIYDSYNDKYFYLPKSVYGAVLMARTDRVANTWDAPAGMSRGIIPSFGQKFTFTSTQIGRLYDRNINTSMSIIGVGNVMWGQKTAQMKHTYLDRINVRRDLIYIENSIEPLLQQFLFEINNDRTRQRITSLVGGFLGDVQAAGGLDGFKVVCDTSNNTSSVISNNQLYCDIYIQPPLVIEFIVLRAIVSSVGVSIQEL